MKISVQATVRAPVAQVWKAYTSPEDIVQWNAASDDWHTTKATVDLRAGVVVTVTFDAEQIHSVEQQREGWQAILNRFRDHVESRAWAPTLRT